MLKLLSNMPKYAPDTHVKVNFHLSVWLQEREQEQENGKGKIKYLIFNRETVTCAKIVLQFDWLLKNNKSDAH